LILIDLFLPGIVFFPIVDTKLIESLQWKFCFLSNAMGNQTCFCFYLSKFPLLNKSLWIFLKAHTIALKIRLFRNWCSFSSWL